MLTWPSSHVAESTIPFRPGRALSHPSDPVRNMPVRTPLGGRLVPMLRAVLPVLFTLAAVLSLSAWGKLAALSRAGSTMAALRLSTRWPRTVVIAASAGELCLAVALLTTGGAALASSAVVMTSAALVFLLLGIRAHRLGSREDCGCFGTIAASRIGIGMHVRNGVLLALGATVVVVAATGEAPSTAVETIVRTPAHALITALAVLGTAILGALILRSPQQADAQNPHVGASLLGPDGVVVDPMQRALRGRAQLLVFVRPGCQSCVRASAAITARSAELARIVDARVIVASGDGVAASVPTDFSGDAVHVDIAGAFAERLGASSARPTALFLGTDGHVLMPHAQGLDEVSTLMDVIVAASHAGT